jgi:hypothetical protein
MKMKYLITIMFLFVFETATNAQQNWQSIYDNSYNTCIANGNSNECCKYFAKWMADGITGKSNSENHPDRFKYIECLDKQKEKSSNENNNCSNQLKAIESSKKAYLEQIEMLKSLEDLKNTGAGGSEIDKQIASAKNGIEVFKKGIIELIDEYNENCDPDMSYPDFNNITNTSLYTSSEKNDNITNEISKINTTIVRTGELISDFDNINEIKRNKLESINESVSDKVSDGSDTFYDLMNNNDINNFNDSGIISLEQDIMGSDINSDQFFNSDFTDISEPNIENIYLIKAEEILNLPLSYCEKLDKMNALQWELRENGQGSELEKNIDVQGMDNTMKTIWNFLDDLKLKCEEYNKTMAEKWQAPRFNSDGTPTKNMEYLLNNSYPSNVNTRFNSPDMSGFFNEQKPKGELTTQTQKEIDVNIINSSKIYVYDQYSKAKTTVSNAKQYVIDQIPSKEQVYKVLPKGLYGTTELTIDYTEKVQKSLSNIHNMSTEQIRAMELESEKYRKEAADESSTGIWRWFK